MFIQFSGQPPEMVRPCHRAATSHCSKRLSPIRVNSACNLKPLFDRFRFVFGDDIMITGSHARVSSRVWLCVAVAALGLMAVSPHLPLRVNAQTVPAQTAQTRRHRQELQADSVAKWARSIRLPRSTLT